MTSGFTAISHNYALAQLENLEEHLDVPLDNKPWADVYDYLDGVANQDLEQQRRAEAQRMLRNLMTFDTGCPGGCRGERPTLINSLDYDKNTCSIAQPLPCNGGQAARAEELSQEKISLGGLGGNAQSCHKCSGAAQAEELSQEKISLGGLGGNAQSSLAQLKEYFHNSYPGKKDSEPVQKLKGMIREWEEELLWGHLGFNENHIFHLRLGF
jgi:hypothetical protein